MFMPWCQAKRGNIIVDFFTTRASAGTNALLDRLGALLLAAAMALLAPDAVWKFPLVQFGQATANPVPVWKVPTTHESHVDAPVLDMYVPAPQLSHTDFWVDPANLPIEQRRPEKSGLWK